MAVAAKDKTEAQWQAESDANTLAQAGEIKRDKKRMKSALIAAMRLSKEQRIKAEELEKIAKTKKKPK